MKPRVAVSLAFLVNGAFFACLACRIPDIQYRLKLDEAQLGLAFLTCATGAILGVASAGYVCARFGSHRTTVFSGLACCLFLALLGFAGGFTGLMASFIGFGLGTGIMDVSMNTNGVAVEKLLPKPIMSSLHGMFSLGGLSFAGVGWLVVKLGASVELHFVCAAILFASVLLWILPRLLPAVTDPGHVPPAFVLPERSVIAVGVIAFCAFLSEGAMGDWSAVYMRKVLHQTPAASTLGYFGFALAMTATRFGGDVILHRCGPTNTLRVCGSITAIGLGAALWFALPWLTVIGFATVGLGMATVAPIAFSLGGRIGGDRPDHAISSIASMGYMAFLVGPGLIGFVAKSWSLREALALVVILALAIVALSGFAADKAAH